MDAPAASPQRLGDSHDTASSAASPCSSNSPPHSTSWVMTATTRTGVVCSGVRASALTTSPNTADATAVSATATMISPIGDPTTSAERGPGRPSRASHTNSTVCTAVTSVNTASLEPR